MKDKKKSIDKSGSKSAQSIVLDLNRGRGRPKAESLTEAEQDAIDPTHEKEIRRDLPKGK